MNRKLLDALNRATTPISRPNPLVMVWRWRYELAFPAGVAVAVEAFGPYSLVAGVVPVLMVLWPPARSEVWGRIRCVITAHRIRVGFVEAYIVSRRGKIPVILWCAPADFGERAWIWCRAGTTPRALEEGRETIASACWATDVRVRPHDRRPHWVLLEVIRTPRPVPRPTPSHPTPGRAHHPNP